MFDYFYGNEQEQYIFLQIPLMLVKDPEFKKISSDSKLLYSLLLNRTSLSAKNGWLDKQGRVYIIYTIEEIQDDLNCAVQKACKLIKELTKIGLIETVRRGLNKPNLIYVKNFATVLKYRNDTKKVPQNPDTTQICENQNSGTLKIKIQELLKSKSSNIYCNNTDSISNLSNLIGFSSEPIEKEKTDMIGYDKISNQSVNGKNKQKSNEGLQNATFRHDSHISKLTTPEYNYTEIEKKIKTQINYTHLVETKIANKDILDEVVFVLTTTICTEYKDNYISMGEERIPAEAVRSIFFKLTSEHIKYFIDCFNKQTKKIIKLASYIRKSLYYNFGTINFHYTNRVYHDMPQLVTQ